MTRHWTGMHARVTAASLVASAFLAPCRAGADETTATYDALNRLRTVSYCDGSGVTYNYDAAGNRTSLTATGGTRTIAVVMPAGGESWQIGSSQSITWTSSGLAGNVDVLLSRDGGLTWETLAGNTANDGTEPWTVTGPAAVQARVRVRGTSCRAVLATARRPSRS